MSAYSKNKTIYKDQECLLKALEAQGYPREQVELHEGNGAQLIDYCGRPTHYLDPTGDKANIIVRRKFVGGAANDLGFKKENDGTYSAIVSRYDTGKHNTKWMTDLKVAYTAAVTDKTAKGLNQKLYSPAKLVQKNGRTVRRIQYLVP